MNATTKIKSILNIQPGEGKLVLLMLTQYFFLGVAFIYVQAAAFALFLAEFKAADLPYVYIASAVAVSLIAYIYLKLSEYLSFSMLLITNLSFLLVSVIASWIGLGITESKWLIFALPILVQALLSLGNLEFWTLASRIFNVRQGKRLFGLIGGGQWIASIITGFLTPIMVALLGTANLLLLGAGGIAVALGLLIYTSHAYSNRLVAPVEKNPTRAVQQPKINLLKNRYIILIFALVAFWWVSFFFIDNIFYDRAVVQFPDGDQLASFIGLFFGVTGVATFITTTFLTGPVISRYGVRVGLLVLPISIIVAMAIFASSGTILGTTVMLLWLVTLAKLFNFAFGFSIDRASLTILYQPLPATQRVRVQTQAEGIVYPLAVGLAGVLLLLLINFFGFNSIQLSYVLILILAAWTVVTIRLGRQEYPNVLMQALVKRRLSGTSVALEDQSSLVVLQKALKSHQAGVVIYALNVLEEYDRDAFAINLPHLITHPAAEVRVEALRRIEQLKLTSALDEVGSTLQSETSATVRAVTLHTLAALGDIETLKEVIYPYLEDPDPQNRFGAIVGLLLNGGVEVTMVADGRLLQLAASVNPAERVLAAQVIGEVGTNNLRQLLEQLLQDEAPQVQRTAMDAAGKTKYPQLWPLVVAGVTSPHVRGSAAAALIAGGLAALPEIQAAFTAPGQERETLIRLANVCGRIGGDQTVAFLRENLDFADDDVRTHILTALSNCRYWARNDERPIVEQQIKAEIADAAATVAALVDIDDDAMNSSPRALSTDGQLDRRAVSLLVRALNSKFAGCRTRIFLLLSFIYEAEIILQAQGVIESGQTSQEKRAYALEVIDLHLHRDLKAILFPLLQQLSPRQRLEQWKNADISQLSLGWVQRLKTIITAPPRQYDSWTKACVLHLIGTLGTQNDLIQAVVSNLGSFAGDPLLSETATWSLATLDDDKQLEMHANRGSRSTVEKVVALNEVSMFAEIPDKVLADVAALFTEVRFESQEPVVAKGETGNCMYVVTSGQVRVHDDDHTITHLTAGEVFGEMALVDSQPRSASVTAIDMTHLLRLDQESFNNLLEDRIDMVQGIVRVLSHRLRASVNELNKLRTHGEGAHKRLGGT